MAWLRALTAVAVVASVSILSACSSDSAMSPHQSTMATKEYQLTRTIPVGGEGRWDFLAFDSDAKVLYVPRSSHTQVIDPASGQVVADIANTGGVHGVAIVPAVGRGFTSNGKTGNVTVFDLKTHAVIGTVPAGQNPDAIVYDPFSQRVFCFNAKGNDATIIDPAAEPAKAAVGTVKFESNPESAVPDGKGHLYVNLEDANAITAVDTRTMKVTATWKIAGGEGPTGLAIDVPHHVLYSGCANKVLACIDTESGQTLATLPIGDGADACTFDPASGEAFASCRDGTITGAHRTADGKFEVVQMIPTKAGARTITIDPATHTLYLPTAEFEPLAAGEKRPKVKDGTFMILVVAPK
jgi:YVTN family beta-propeller protein